MRRPGTWTGRCGRPVAALHARSAGGGLRIGRHNARDARRAAGRRRRSGGSRFRALGMPPAMTSLRVLLLVTLGVLPIQSARAQGTQPLRKAELVRMRSEEHTSELQSHSDLVCRLLLEKKKKKNRNN